MDGLRFTIPEILSLFGVAQCLYIIVYMFFRSGRISRAGLALLYFSVLALAFAHDFAASSFGKVFPYFKDIGWALWFLGPTLSVLLVIQIAQISRLPSIRYYWILLLIPISYGVAYACKDKTDHFYDLLTVCGLVSGGISLLALWFNRSVLETLGKEKSGKDRYWLILSLVLMNSAFLGLMLMSVSFKMDPQNTRVIKTILGIGFVYLANTSLFRIYPQAVSLMERRSPDRLKESEYQVALKIQDLLDLDKVYHEPSYSRADMARECNLSEANVSRIINAYFKKSFIQVLNERRVEDAKRMLKQTDVPIKVIAEEVGFNALASFNRVFKEITGKNPSKFRN